MKLASFSRNGSTELGLIEGDEVIPISPVLPQGVVTMSDLIRQVALSDLPALAERARERVPLSEVALEVPVSDPGKIVCVGLNYEAHRIETGRDVTKAPTLFLRLPTSHVAHDQPVRKPAFSDKLDYEGEIALIVGKGGREISEADAWNHVFGYSCYNDISVRDWQGHTTQFTPGKNFDGVGSFGPWIVTADEIGANPDIRLTTRLNGEVMQDTRSSQMTFSIPELIAYISRFSALNPGDVIVTGTPGGVGARREPPVFMKPGDIVEIEVERVGVLRNRIT